MFSHNFKALPLNRKVGYMDSLFKITAKSNVLYFMECLNSFFYMLMQIFSSKGDMGVFRNSKRDVTVPVVGSVQLSF